jgi:hypothetical protein
MRQLTAFFLKINPVLLLFLLSIVIIFPLLYPRIHDIGVFDEAQYVNGGRLLLQGHLPTLVDGPFVYLFYAITYLPVQVSPYWLIYSCILGRSVFFILLLAVTYIVGRRISPPMQRIMILLLIISPVLPRIITNGSEALFTIASGFALWQLLSFYYDRNRRHLWLLSIYLGLAALSRREGFVILVIAGIFCSVFSWRDKISRSLLAFFTPFIIIVGGYLVFYGATAGNLKTGMAEMSYFNFEHGQGNAFSDVSSGRNIFLDGKIESVKLYGTAQENNNSVLKAISRNPSAYIRRIQGVLKHIPYYISMSYGGYLTTFFIFLFSGIGLVTIIRKKLFGILSILLLWPAYSVAYIFIVCDNRYFASTYIPVFYLASVGISSIFSDSYDGQKKDIIMYLLAFSGILFVIIGMRFNLSAAFIILLWILIIYAIRYSARGVYPLRKFGVVALVISMLFSSYASKTRLNNIVQKLSSKIGVTDKEQAAIFLINNLKPGANVATFSAIVPIMAKMKPVYMCAELRWMKSDEDLLSWVIKNRIKAIYVDQELKTTEPSLLVIINRQIGKNFRVVFTSNNKEAQVLFVK